MNAKNVPLAEPQMSEASTAHVRCNNSHKTACFSVVFAIARVCRAAAMQDAWINFRPTSPSALF